MKNILHLPGSAACNGQREGVRWWECAQVYLRHTETHAQITHTHEDTQRPCSLYMLLAPPGTAEG